MSVKTALIEDVLNEKTWDGPNGRVYYYDLVLDNGERGSIGTKTRDSFKINDSLTYTATNDERGTKFKKVNPDGGNFGGGGQRQGGYQQQRQQKGGQGSNVSFALAYARDLMIAAMPHHPEITINQWVEATTVTATKFLAWMEEHSE